MAMPETVRVKLSSEAAGAISITPVVAQEMAIRELIGHMLGLAGKDEARLREILQRGTLVSGGTRFRWAGWDADLENLRKILETFPDPDPTRAFSAAECVRAVLRAQRQSVEISREAAAARGLFRRRSFWDEVLEIAVAAEPVYANYSYRDRADRYVCELSPELCERLRAASAAARYTALRDRVRAISFTQAEFYVGR
jgi:hypothetical protein